MSFFGKIVNAMKFNDEEDDDYFLDDDYEEDDRPVKRGLFSRNNTEDEDYYDDEDRPASRSHFLPRSNSSSKVVPMRRGMEVSLIKPTSMEDSSEICDYLLAGKAVVLNMEGIHTEIAQRIIDFTSGAAYSMSGNLQKISNYIFIATPESVELSGDFQDLLSATSGGTGGNSNSMDMPGVRFHL
ncbi:cell division protein SepF [Lachnospiraceae bacterium 62-35]